METEKLNERIRVGEDSRTEFKREDAHNDDLAAAIVSFANGTGGDLILGIDNDRQIVGVSNSDQLALRLDQVCRQNVDPPCTHALFEKHDLGGRLVGVLHIPRGPQRPYRTNKGVYFIRGLAGRRIATRQELLEIYQSAGALYPDELAVEDAEERDIDGDYLRRMYPQLAAISSDEDLRRTLYNKKILHSNGRQTLGGVLCFAKNPDRFKPYARITAIRHKGNEIGEDFADHKEFRGRLDRQIAEAQEFVRGHVGDRPGEPQPLRTFPFQSVDEAIVNAVAHRDYLAAAQIRLFVFDDRLEIISPGKLLNSVTVATMKEGYHLVRNPFVFSHLAKLGLATDAGRGVPNMLMLARAAGLPEPEIAVVGAELRVSFRFRS